MLKLVRQSEDIARLRGILQTFYTEQRANYGLDDSRQDGINDYVSNVVRIAESRSSVLDFGCGNWRSPVALAGQGFTVTGLDMFSSSDLASFSSHVKDVSNARLVSYDGSARLPFPDASFEVISSLCVFEHLIDVESVLKEFKRALKPKGRVMIQCPNWSGPNNCLRAILTQVRQGKRYFQYETAFEAARGLALCSTLPLQVKFSEGVRWMYILPRLSDGRILFERADDDAVHLCVPTSFKKWFTKNGFHLTEYNNRCGSSKLVRICNRLMPWFATSNLIIAEKE